MISLATATWPSALAGFLASGFRRTFSTPYLSGSITEFWRRWHISLGSWFRDYLYIPLGGNRKGSARQLLNILLVWLATSACGTARRGILS